MASSKNNEEPFPWHLGVYDAHCHPTDNMTSMQTLVNMKARVLTVMATRAEDQDLVLAAAEKHGIRTSDPDTWTQEQRMLPCFGWHPWFAHQMYISDDEEFTSKTPEPLTGDAKITHYQSVLQPLRPNPSPEDLSTFHALPDPTPLSSYLSQTRKYLLLHPHALIGEIGLDRAFRIPEPWPKTPSSFSQRDSALTLGGREGRRLTPFRCTPQHQRKVFEAQMRLAGELGRAVSVHGVQAHGMLLESIASLWIGHEKVVPSKREKKKCGKDDPSVESKLAGANGDDAGGPGKPFPPRICLHSYSGNASNFKQYLHPAVPARIFASFSTAINLGDGMGQETPAAFEEVIKAVPDESLLVESDLDRAGEDIDMRLEDMVRRMCKIKGWGLEEGVRQLGENWRAFGFGDDR